MLKASCVAGIVTAGILPVVSADVLSDGIGPSDGVVLIDEDEAVYIPNTTPDLKSALESVASALGTIASTLTAIGAQMLGPSTAPPPTLPASVASISAVQAELVVLKEMLK